MEVISKYLCVLTQFIALDYENIRNRPMYYSSPSVVKVTKIGRIRKVTG